MSNKEINKVIEDKAISYFTSPKGHSIHDISHFKEGMKEALSNPTDIGLCRWVKMTLDNYPRGEWNGVIKRLCENSFLTKTSEKYLYFEYQQVINGTIHGCDLKDYIEADQNWFFLEE